MFSTGLLDRPDLDLSKLPTPDTDNNFGDAERNKDKVVGGGSYRYMSSMDVHVWHGIDLVDKLQL